MNKKYKSDTEIKEEISKNFDDKIKKTLTKEEIKKNDLLIEMCKMYVFLSVKENIDLYRKQEELLSASMKKTNDLLKSITEEGLK